MNLSINAITSYGKLAGIQNKTANRSQQVSSLSFQGLKTNKGLRYAGYALASAIMASTLGCANRQAKNGSSDEVVNVITKTEKTDSSYVSIDEYYYRDKRVQTIYHYNPTEDCINSTNYNWIEMVYPDGRIEKDSMNYKILITPEGERTEVKTEEKDNGDKVITSLFPDGSKRVYIKNDTNYIDTIYWANGKIKQIQIFQQASASETDSDKAIEKQVFKRYDEDENLLYWQIFDSSVNADDYVNQHKYDKKDRLIDDSFVKYLYKGNSKTPYKTIEEVEGCKFITEYNSDGTPEKRYFYSSNKIITPVEEVLTIKW